MANINQVYTQRAGMRPQGICESTLVEHTYLALTTLKSYSDDPHRHRRRTRTTDLQARSGRLLHRPHSLRSGTETDGSQQLRKSLKRLRQGLARSSSDGQQFDKKFKSFQNSNTVLDRNATIELAIEALSTVCSTDFKATEIEIGVCSTAEDEPVPEGEAKGAGLFRQMSEEERGEWLTRVGEKD